MTGVQTCALPISGNMYVSGLPFTSLNVSNAYYSVSAYCNGLSMTAGYVLTALVNINNTIVSLEQAPVGGGATISLPIDTAVTQFFVSGIYESAN